MMTKREKRIHAALRPVAAAIANARGPLQPTDDDIEMAMLSDLGPAVAAFIIEGVTAPRHEAEEAEEARAIYERAHANDQRPAAPALTSA